MNDKICPRCGGIGGVQYELGLLAFVCYFCNGTGRIFDPDPEVERLELVPKHSE